MHIVPTRIGFSEFNHKMSDIVAVGHTHTEINLLFCYCDVIYQTKIKAACGDSGTLPRNSVGLKP